MDPLISPAPGQLELVRRFVNTADVEEGTDELATAEAASSWLRKEDLPAIGGQLTEAEASRLRRAREALREALAAHHPGDEISPAALAVLNEEVGRAELTVRMDPDGYELVPRAGDRVSHVLASLLLVVLDAMRDRTWPRLKVCSNSGCRWAFYDRSRARSGKWCSMQICGNRSKQQAWRERQS